MNAYYGITYYTTIIRNFDNTTKLMSQKLCVFRW